MSPKGRFALAADLLDPPVWHPDGRELLPHQLPPPGDWTLFLLEGGRGSGKTFACMSYLAAFMRRHPAARGRIIAPTFADAVESCVEGPSGLLELDPEVRWQASAPGGAKIVWPNGSEVLLLGTPTPRDVDRLRASGNRHIDVYEEMAANPQLDAVWDQAQLGLRLGDHPHSIAATTPRPTLAYKRIRELAGTVRKPATLQDNPHASPEWRRRMLERYEGTRLARQEIAGELIEDSEQALVRREWIESQRVDQAPPELVRMRAVGLDPGGKGSQGLVMVASALDGQLYVERSEMVSGSGAEFLRHAIVVAQAHDAVLVVEKNHGGEYLRDLLSQVMQERGAVVGVQMVWASAGKRTRAEPVALLIEQGKVKWCGPHAQLEDEWATWEPESSQSPHLLDAMVWACSALSNGMSTVGREDQLRAVPFTDAPAPGMVPWGYHPWQYGVGGAMPFT